MSEARRAGELRLAAEPPADATLAFIGRIRTPWGADDCPRNPAEARARGGGAVLEIAAPYRPGLEGIAPGDALILLYWMDGAERALIRLHPPHRDAPAGVFALRAPARPNPVALSAVRCTGIDAAAGRVETTALDCHDGTPLLDIKPHRPGVDAP